MPNPRRAQPSNSRGVTRRDFLRYGGGVTAYSLLGGLGVLAAACTDQGGATTTSAVGSATSIPTGNGETMTFWNHHSPGGPSDVASAWFVDMVEEWNSRGNRPIELNYIPAAEYAEGTPLRTAFAADAGPDIFLLSPTDFLRYWNQDLILDLTDYLGDGVVDDFFQAPIETRLVDDRVFGIPFEAAPVGMYYSLDAIEAAGISEDNLPTTWEDFTDMAEQLTTDEQFGTLFETNPGAFQTFMWWPWYWQTGAEIVTADGAANFNTPETARALRLWKEAIEKGIAPRTVQGPGSLDIVSNLASGYCATQECGTWALAALDASEPDFRFGVYPLPSPSDGTYTTVVGGWGFCVNAQGKDPEAAAEFVAWAVGGDTEESIQRHADWAILRTAMPTRMSALGVAQEGGYLADGPGRVFAEEIYPQGRSEPRYPAEVNDAVNEAIQSSMLGGLDTAEAAETAHERIASFLREYSGGPLL